MRALAQQIGNGKTVVKASQGVCKVFRLDNILKMCTKYRRPIHGFGHADFASSTSAIYLWLALNLST